MCAQPAMTEHGKFILRARASGMWSVPCSASSETPGSSILTSARQMRIGPKCARETLLLPSRSRNLTSSIPQTRAALSTMASSTGCTSVGDRLMMPEHLGGCRLMFQRLAQFCVALLEFL